MKKSKQEKKFSSELKKGDKIITIGGIHAKVLDFNITDGTCIVETSSGKMKIEMSAISMDKSVKLNAPKEVKEKK